MFKRMMAVVILMFISGIVSSPMIIAQTDISLDPSKKFSPVIKFKDGYDPNEDNHEYYDPPSIYDEEGPETVSIPPSRQVNTKGFLYPGVFEDLYAEAVKAVVTIIVISEPIAVQDFENTLPKDSPFNKLFEEQRDYINPQAIGSGSGFIVSEDGLVYTNHHVVSESNMDYEVTQIQVVWNDYTWRNATIVATDQMSDFAILQIIPDEETPNEKFTFLEVVSSASLKPGTIVAAIGSPLDYDFSITMGIISGLERSRGQGRWVSMIQTDAALNKGNSGGPLLNLNGQVIGMSSALVSPTGFYAGIGLVLPSDIIIAVATQLLTEGDYVRPYVGIQLSSVNPSFKEKVDIPVDQSTAIVMEVRAGSPASAAGLKKYDIILSWDGETLDPTSITAIIGESMPGDIFQLMIRRVANFDTLEYIDLPITLIIGEMPDEGL